MPVQGLWSFDPHELIESFETFVALMYAREFSKWLTTGCGLWTNGRRQPGFPSWPEVAAAIPVTVIWPQLRLGRPEGRTS